MVFIRYWVNFYSFCDKKVFYFSFFDDFYIYFLLLNDPTNDLNTYVLEIGNIFTVTTSKLHINTVCWILGQFLIAL